MYHIFVVIICLALIWIGLSDRVLAGLGAFVIFCELCFFITHFTEQFFERFIGTSLIAILTVTAFCYQFFNTNTFYLAAFLLLLHGLVILAQIIRRWHYYRQARRLRQLLLKARAIPIRVLGVRSTETGRQAFIGVGAETDREFTDFLKASGLPQNLQAEWQSLENVYLLLRLRISANKSVCIALYIGEGQHSLLVSGTEDAYPVQREVMKTFLLELEATHQLCIVPTQGQRFTSWNNGQEIHVPKLPEWRSGFSDVAAKEKNMDNVLFPYTDLNERNGLSPYTGLLLRPYSLFVSIYFILLPGVPGLRQQLTNPSQIISISQIEMLDVLSVLGGVIAFVLIVCEGFFFFWMVLGGTDPSMIGTVFALIVAALSWFTLGVKSLAPALLIAGLYFLWLFTLVVQQRRNQRTALALRKQLEQALKGRKLLWIERFGAEEKMGGVYIRIAADEPFTELVTENGESRWQILRFGDGVVYLVLNLGQQFALPIYIGKSHRRVEVRGIWLYEITGHERPVPGLGGHSNLAQFLDLLNAKLELAVLPSGVRLHVPRLPAEWRSQFSEFNPGGWIPPTTYLDPCDPTSKPPVVMG